ncbi:MAG: hypothetical protein ITG02_13815 [Patulibacter sp.]|nr:hypothetical protein [Patulibacter sp.]
MQQAGRIGHGRRALRAAVAVAALALGAVAAPTASAAFGIDGMSAPMVDQGGDQVTQAGAHPFAVENEIVVTKVDPMTISGALKNVEVDLPVGFVGDPSDFPTCTIQQLAKSDCPVASQVGTFDVTFAFGYTVGQGLYNMEVPHGQPARFGSPVLMGTSLVYFDARVRPEDDGISVVSNNISQELPIAATKMRMWGIPADPAHDAERGSAMVPAPQPAGMAPRPMLTTATRCGVAPVTRMRASSWNAPSVYEAAEFTGEPLTGCDVLEFRPQVKAQPEHTIAGVPAGYTVELTQELNDSPTALASAHLKDASVTLPEGVTVNPGAGSGLGACSEQQFGLGRDGAARCPASAKIGEVEIETPLLNEPLVGAVYQAAQYANPFGSSLAIYLEPTSERYGVTMKLAGEIATDPVTGRVTTTFRDNPEQPFSKLTLTLKGGSRAVLSNPATCGTKTTAWTIGSWAQPDAPVRGSDSFTIDRAPAGGSCAGDLFAPTFGAGAVDPRAGASSPVAMTFARGDGQQNLASITAELPEGLLAHVGSVPLCPAAHADAGACGAASRIGNVVAAVGGGNAPLAVPQPGKAATGAFLSGPYAGAPYSLSLVIPAQAGPLNLGSVVSRVALFVDPRDAHVAAKLVESRVFDPAGRPVRTVAGLPQIIDGIPLTYRSITVTMDRPGFMRNPTSCAPKALKATIGSAAGAVVGRESRFQVSECGRLPLAPKLDLRFVGSKQVAKGKHPGLEVTMTQRSGESGLKSVEVALPLSVALDPQNAKALCSPADAARRACPKASIVGHAEARTPILSEPLKGDVFFVEGVRRSATGREIKTLPKLLITLRGAVALDLEADSTVRDRKLVSTFGFIPDAPLESFRLTIDGGRNGILESTGTDGRTLCHSTQKVETRIQGQTGKRIEPDFRIATPCAMRVLTRSLSTSHLTVRTGGLQRGRLTVTGSHVRRTSRSIKAAQVATIKPRLTAAGRRAARAGRQVQARVTFNPSAKGKKTVKRTVKARMARR